jgi:hypothetical protein
MEKRIAHVVGSCLVSTPSEPFVGQITFDLHPECVYYEWRIKTKGGDWGLSRPVSLRVVPNGADPFEYALQHAIEGLRRYRSNRKRVFEINEIRRGFLKIEVYIFGG